MQNTGPAIAQFTAGATARRTLLQLGFVPDLAIILGSHDQTNPNILVWVNKGGQTLPADQQVNEVTTLPDVISQWLDADDHLLITGTTGVITRVTTGIKAYLGGDLIAADEDVDANPVHPFSNGGFPKAGERTAAGLEFPAAILTATQKYVVIAFRRMPDQQVGGFTV